jgi:hypothetical protein
VKARHRSLPSVEVQKERYLHGFAVDCTMTSGCQLAQCDYSTVHKWREMDDTFVLRENELRTQLADRLEHEALRRAYEGYDRPVFQRGVQVGVERVYSDVLLKMMLSAMKPDKYRENVHVSGTVEQVVRQVIGFDPTEVL